MRGLTDSCRLAILVILFAGGMASMEIFTEALFTVPDLPRTIGLWTTTSQFIFCTVVPVLWERKSAECGSKDNKIQACSSTLIYTWGPCVVLAAFQFMSSLAAIHAVHFVENNVKVVFKASKLLPVMLIGTFMGNSRRYTPPEYMAALLLCVGTAIFSSSSGRAASGNTGHGMMPGLCLLSFAVLADAALPNAQQRMMKNGMPASTLMFRLNAIGGAAGAVGLLVSGEVSRLSAYFHRNPHVVNRVVAIGISIAIAVMSYTQLIKECGSVFAVSVSTLRKTFTVAISYILFPGKSFDGRCAIGLALVCAGLVQAEWISYRRARSKDDEPPPAPVAADVELGKRSCAP